MITGMFLFVILVSVVLFGFQVTKYMITSAGVEDALAASNLASAIIDLEEYGKTHKISIPNPESAFALYREALSVNLELDENLNTTNRDFISSQVEIKQYIVYNLWEDTIEIFDYGLYKPYFNLIFSLYENSDTSETTTSSPSASPSTTSTYSKLESPRITLRRISSLFSLRTKRLYVPAPT